MKQFFISQKNLERPNTIIIGSNCKGGQKRQDLSTDISKRGNPPPPPNYVEFWAKWVEIIPFWGATLLGDEGMNAKPFTKWSLGAESFLTITWKSFFQPSQVVSISTVASQK